MTMTETLRMITGPSLRELVENGDYKTARSMVVYSWIGMICAGFAIGVYLSRIGWV